MLELKKYLSQNKYLSIILVVLIILITTDNSSFNSLNNFELIIAIFLWFFLIINDLSRNIFKLFKNRVYLYSLTISILLAAFLTYFTGGLLVFYFYYFYIIEILYLNKKYKRFFLILHSLLYFLNTVINKLIVDLSGAGVSLLVYFTITYMLYITHSIHMEKLEIQKLNEKLRNSNIKLHQYSRKVEKLSIRKERERVAQELHDSLGHSLMALIMHLEFAEKIFDTNPEKSREVITKTRQIAKNSTSKLRQAVNTLKEERKIKNLRSSITELIDNFLTLSNIKIDFSMDQGLESLSPEIKLSIYKTIMESLTNGIKHGKATVFKLDLNKSNDYVKLDIIDNGIGCDQINMSDGLKGIKNRITTLNGTINFQSQKNKGFITKAQIPIQSQNDNFYTLSQES